MTELPLPLFTFLLKDKSGAVFLRAGAGSSGTVRVQAATTGILAVDRCTRCRNVTVKVINHPCECPPCPRLRSYKGNERRTRTGRTAFRTLTHLYANHRMDPSGGFLRVPSWFLLVKVTWDTPPLGHPGRSPLRRTEHVGRVHAADNRRARGVVMDRGRNPDLQKIARIQSCRINRERLQGRRQHIDRYR